MVPTSHLPPPSPAPPSAAVDAGPHRMTIGLKPLREAKWIDGGDDYVPQLHERARLLAQRHDDVVAALPDTAEAQAEVLEMLVTHLCTHRPDDYQLDGRSLHVRELDTTLDLAGNPACPFDIAARIVPEDLCLMRAGDDGGYRLVAAALCFPTRWRLSEKLGQPMLTIHAPVPDYAASIGGAVDRLMAALKVERPMWRQNWSLLDAPDLFQSERPPPGGIGRALGEQLWLRSERQVLRRLPATGDVLFTIRVRQMTLADACEMPGLRERLAGQLASMPSELLGYKGLGELRPALLEYLSSDDSPSFSRVSARL